MRIFIPSKTLRRSAVGVLQSLDAICPEIRAQTDSKTIGGYLYIAHPINPKAPILVMYVGEERERHEKYRRLAEEKCVRLAEHEDHDLSFQSKDEAKGQYQGAICFKATSSPQILIVSFSGLPAEADEAYCLLLSVKSECLDMAGAIELASISNNKTFLKAAENFTRVRACETF